MNFVWVQEIGPDSLPCKAVVMMVHFMLPFLVLGGVHEYWSLFLRKSCADLLMIFCLYLSTADGPSTLVQHIRV